MAKKAEAEQAETTESREVAVTAPTGMIQLSQDELSELEGVEGAGLSDNVEDRGTPLLYIAQKGSKQVNSKKPEYIPGLEVGMAFNNLTGKFWDTENEGMIVLPCYFRVNWLEWTPVDDGGGFHGIHERDTPLLRQSVEREGRRDLRDLPNGHELVLTHHYYCIIAETWQPIIIPMSSTNLGASSKMQALIGDQKAIAGGRVVTKPAYWSKFLLKTAYSENEKGDWYKWVPSLAGQNTDPALRNFCKEFAMACTRNEVEMSKPLDPSFADPVEDDGDAPI